MEKKFENLNELYEFIEENALNYEYSDLGDLFLKLKKSKKNKDLQKKAQWEIDFFYFNTHMGEITPSISKISDDGKKHLFPNLNNFDEDAYNYLIERLNNTNNPLLKACYANILWNSPNKHRKYAEIAVNSYLELVQLYEKKDLKEIDNNYGLKIVESISNAYKIALSSRYNVEKVKSDIKRLIHNFNFNSNNSLYLRRNLIELMLNEKKIFIKEDFIGINDILWKMSEKSTVENDYQKTLLLLDLGIKVENKLDTDKFSWEKSIAESYESLMDDADKNDDNARLYFCENALKHYINLKDDVKISELEKKYLSFKNSRKLKKIETPVDLTETLDRCREIADEIIQDDSIGVIQYLMHNENILPKLKEVEKFVDEEMSGYFSSNLPTSSLDHNGHVSQHFSEPDEMRYYNILKHYQMTIELNTINLLNTVFITAITENKLSYDILVEFLIEKSWVGKTIEKKLPKGEISQKNWLNTICPSLYEYFNLMILSLLDPNYDQNFVLIIDSLTLKLEGLLRDICQRLGIATFYQTQDKEKRVIAREKDINALLREEKLKELFTEDELMFFKFLLVEKAGYNIRHKIAHSLMDDNEYQMGIFHLLLLMMLRLGKYDFGSEEVGSEEVGSEEVGSEEVGSEEVGSEEVGSEEVGSEEVGSEEVGSEEVGSEEVGSEEVGSEEVGSEEVDLSN